MLTSSVGVEHFLVDLDGKDVFVPTPSVGVVRMWWCVCDLDFKSMPNLSQGSTKLDKTQCNSSNIYMEVFLA